MKVEKNLQTENMSYCPECIPLSEGTADTPGLTVVGGELSINWSVHKHLPPVTKNYLNRCVTCAI